MIFFSLIGCDISIPSKVMDFCRINESVPCDEVWHHVDPKVFSYDMVNLTNSQLYGTRIYHTHALAIQGID